MKEIEFPFYKYKHEGVQYTRSMSINVIRRVIIDSVSKKQWFRTLSQVEPQMRNKMSRIGLV